MDTEGGRDNTKSISTDIFKRMYFYMALMKYSKDSVSIRRKQGCTRYNKKKNPIFDNGLENCNDDIIAIFYLKGGFNFCRRPYRDMSM